MLQRVDTESRATHDDHLSVRVWLRLLACTNLVEGRVASRLRDDFDTTLPRFDFLSQLERNPAGLRMTEISQRMMVTGGNITRIADQLLAEGLITRSVAPGDRRASIVKLSAAGRRAFAEMARRHEEWIVEMFGGLAESERNQLYALLAKLKRHLNAVESEVRGR
jgi:DNA-binding MarR family transcriptional regulator